MTAVLLLVSSLVFISSCGRQENQPDQTENSRPQENQPGQAENIKIATMRLGTSWYVFGATLYQLLKEELPSGTRIEIIAKGGGIGNPIMVNSGDASIALSNVTTAVWAWNGHPDVYQGKQHKHIRALVGGLNSVWVTPIVREEFLKKSGQSDLQGVLIGGKPLRIVMKPRGSSIPVVADMIMAAMGTDRGKIQANKGRIIQVSAKQIPSIIRDGRADLYFEGAPIGHPTVTEVCLTTPMRFLDLPPDVLKKLSAEGLQPSSIPKYYKGQTKPTMAVDLGTMIIANENLSEEMAYLITKTICENKESMAKAHKAWSNFQPELSGKPENTGIPLHPGAHRYYEEKGWLTDKSK